MDILLLIPIFVITVGAYMLFRLRFFIFRPKALFQDVRGLLKKSGAFKNLCLALSGTLGVGNIVGVAVGLKIGGAGSVFWLMISAIPAAVIKYSESALAASGGGEGMMCVIESSFKKTGRGAARVYALFAVLLALLMGAGLQCASFSETFASLFGISDFFPLLIIFIPAALVMLFGASKIKDLTALSVSTASVVYVFSALYLIFLGRANLPSAIGSIFSCAFTSRAAVGGAGAALVTHALREGFCRGILSNEAGLGTSAMAHATDARYTSHEAGLIGVLEVIFDTAILCPLSALMLLTSGDGRIHDPIGYVLSAVSKGGDAVEYLFAVSIFCFAFSTVICWISYGSLAFSYLFGKRRGIFAFLFLLALPTGSLVGAGTLVLMIDYVMLPLAVICMLTLIKNSDRAVLLYRSKK